MMMARLELSSQVSFYKVTMNMHSPQTWDRHRYRHDTRGTHQKPCTHHFPLAPSEMMLITLQGTLAKSGTSEFLTRAEGADTTGTGNLIGAFGLGFYSRYELPYGDA